MKLKIENAGADTGGIWAELSDGTYIYRRISCNSAAYAQLVSDIAARTGQTDQGVKRSLRKWMY